MQLKNKKRAMMLLISLCLATTSCGKEEPNIKEGYEEYLEDYLDESRHYEKNSQYNINRNDIKEFYQIFFNALISNMSDEDYETIKDDIDINDYNMEVILKDIYDQIPDYEGTFGHGFFLTFREQLREDAASPYRFLRDEVYSNVNTLRTIINNDEAFFNSVFSYDINNVIECIMDNTGYKNRSLIEELILNIDSYVDVTKYDDISYQDEMLANNYKKRIKEIMNTIITFKCEHDEEFKNSFYGRTLMNSNYFDGQLNIYQELFGIKTCIVDTREDLPYSIMVSYNNLYGSSSLEQLKEIYLEDKITSSYENYEYDTLDFDNIYMELLVTLVDSNALNDAGKFGHSVRPLMYKNLASYFSSEDEFNTFVLSLSENDSKAQNYFFEVFLKTLKKDDITYDDFIRYMSLANYITSHTITHIDYYYNSAPYQEILSMPESEYEDYIDPYYESFIFDNRYVSYLGYLEQMREILEQNNLGYEMTYNPNCHISWQYGPLYPASGSTIVVSEKVNPQKMNYNGTNIIYYEVPDNYPDAWGVETFINCEAEYSIRRVEGIKETIIDQETNEPKSILIVSINGDLDEFNPISFASYYYYYNQAEKNKMKTLEGDYYE